MANAEKDMEETRARNRSAIQEERSKFVGRKIIFLIILPVLIFLITGISAALGSADITMWDAYSTILHKFFPNHFGTSWLADVCVWHLRLPRIVWGIMAGFGLGIAGCAMQAILKNPLASPFTLGISAGAGFGVAVSMVLPFSLFGGVYMVIGNSFLFAMLTSACILGLAKIRGGTSELLILAGIAMHYLFLAASELLGYLASGRVGGGMGGDMLGVYEWEEMKIVFTLLIFCSLGLMMKSWGLNAMGAGDDTAKSLGVNAQLLRVIVMVVTSLLVAGVVTFVGIFGFIGLVGPHMARMIIGSDHRFLLPASGFLGSVLLIGADTVGRRIMAPIFLPVSTMTALLGVPFFLYLIIRSRREYW